MTNLKKYTYITQNLRQKFDNLQIGKKTLLLLIIGKIKQAAILSSYLTNEIQKMNYAQQ